MSVQEMKSNSIVLFQTNAFLHTFRNAIIKYLEKEVLFTLLKNLIKELRNFFITKSLFQKKKKRNNYVLQLKLFLQHRLILIRSKVLLRRKVSFKDQRHKIF